jgi:thiosulfate/3-mercaptopyruvate sulfurtransferase
VFVDLDRWLAAPASPHAGRHPLPDPEVFAAGMRAAGVGPDTMVVAYDDAGGAYAARLVWLLRRCGHPAALLDGGLHAWPAPLSTVAPVVTEGGFTLDAWPVGAVADASDVAAALADGVPVIDARAAQRFTGAQEPVDARAGHIPGARNLPHRGNLGADGRRFLPPDALRTRYVDAGVDSPGSPQPRSVIVYCGSGVTACHALLAMEHAGLPPGRLYPGSWSQWSADPARPVATGDDSAEEAT